MKERERAKEIEREWDKRERNIEQERKNNFKLSENKFQSLKIESVFHLHLGDGLLYI